MSFFSHTLKAAEQENSSLNLFLLKYLREEGITLNFCDIWQSHHGLYLLLNDLTLIKILIHQAVLADRDFQAQGVPHFHFAPCKHVREILASDEAKKSHVASIAHSNAFTFKIAGMRAALRVHHDAPLEPCADCLELTHMTSMQAHANFETLSSCLYAPASNIAESEYESLVNFFKDTFKNTCSYCHEKVSSDSLFLVQNEQAAFSLICDRHQSS